MVWLVDSLSIGRLLVTADVASVRALFVANLAVTLADFVEDGPFLGTGMGTFAAATVAASTVSGFSAIVKVM
jgi:hypothetical protein